MSKSSANFWRLFDRFYKSGLIDPGLGERLVFDRLWGDKRKVELNLFLGEFEVFFKGLFLALFIKNNNKNNKDTYVKDILFSSFVY